MENDAICRNEELAQEEKTKPLTDTFYTREDTLCEIPIGRAKIVVKIGHKNLRGEPKKYCDIRTWYPDTEGIYKPGRGFAKPMTDDELLQMAEAIRAYVLTGATLQTVEG